MKGRASRRRIWNPSSSASTRPSGPAIISAEIPALAFPLPGRSSKERAGASMPRTAPMEERGWLWNCRWRPMAEVNIHASCIALGSAGVLLLGKSGAGKSDLALRLIDDGATLVADDRTILFAQRGALHARAPDSIRGLLEIRGVGIVKLRSRANVKISLVVRLGREDERLPVHRLYRPPPQLSVRTPPPEIALDGTFASTPARIRMALAAFSKGLFRDTFVPK